MDLPTFLTVLPIGGSAVYAFIKVGMVAGRTDSRLGNLTTGVAELTQSLRAFAEKADERLTVHGEELAAHRVEIAAIKTALHRRQGSP